MEQAHLKSRLGVFFMAATLWGCGMKGPGSSGSSNRTGPTFQGPSELPTCGTVTTYPGAVAISGTAQYQARVISGGLGDPTLPRPIRQAEIRVTNSAGAVVQCGTTSDAGTFSLNLPANATYTISVLARSNNQALLRASVLNRPERNEVYSVSRSVVVGSSPQSNVDLLATVPSTGPILGAAFNIFDQIYNANIYLRSKVTGFTAASKITAYWEKGFNPGTYFNPNDTGLSFYLPGYYRLFILGGLNGDVDYSDTDHFDNSVILHEYGHFLEDAYTRADSQGGPHFGNGIIDPRLAWGEGWGNFFQAAVRNDPYYIDTYGNIDGSTQFVFNIPLENTSGVCPGPGCDLPANPGEGNFREFAVARYLWDIHDNATDGGADTVSDRFIEIWSVLTSITKFKSANVAFREVGLLNLFQYQARLADPPAWSDWSALQTTHGMVTGSTGRNEYGRYLATGGSCGALSFAITPNSGSAYFSETIDNVPPINDLIDKTNANGLLDSSFGSGIEPPGGFNHHWVINSDFHHIYHSGGALTLTLSYKEDSGTSADLDLYLYNQTALIGWVAGADNLLDYSIATPTSAISNTETETLSANLPLGHYLIHVNAYRGQGGPTHYELKAGTSQLCGANYP